MNQRKRNYLVASIVTCLLGVLLIYKNSLGKYIDPWLKDRSKYKGHMSYWVFVAGIALIIIAILLSLVAFAKEPAPKPASGSD